jgi:hypothetical protein
MSTALNAYKVTPVEYLEYTKEILNKLNTDLELQEAVEYILRDLDISDGFFQALTEYEGE